MSAQSFPSLIVHTKKKGKAVWFAALGFSSIVHVTIFQGLALDNSKPELKPRVTIIALKEIISEHPASHTYPKRPTPQIPLPEPTSVTTIALTSVTSATTLTEKSALLPSTSLPVAPEMPDEALKSPENLLPKEIDSYLPEIKAEFESSVQLQLEPELSIEVEPRLIIGAKAQVIATQAAETREKIEVFDKAEAEKSGIFQKSRTQKVFEMTRAAAKKEVAVERLRIAQEKLRIAQLAAKLEREQLDAQKAVEIERLKIIHERKAMEAAEIEGERLKALKGSATERLRIVQDGKVQQAAEPGDVRLKVRQEAKVDRPGIAEEQRQQILQATERIKIASQEETVLKDIQANYEEALVAELARHKKYPLSAQRRGHEAVIWISFKINAAGNLISFKFESPSRYKDLNRAVELMFKRAFPVSPVPKELRGAQKEFWYTLPVEFKI